MGIGADNKIAGGQMAALGHHLMADAVANVVEHRTRLFGERAHLLVRVRSFDMRWRRIMVHHQRGAFGEGQTLRTELGRHFQGVAGTRIVHHREIDLGDDNVTGAHWFAAGMGGENFFSNGVTHQALQKGDAPQCKQGAARATF